MAMAVHSDIGSVARLRRPSFGALAYRVMQKSGRARSIEAAATERVVVSPEEHASRPAAYSLPGQIDRVRETHAETSMETELRRIGAGPVTHVATIAYRLDGGRLLDGFLYAGGARSVHRAGQETLGPKRLDHQIDECALPTSFIGSRYFGHFLLDDCCTSLMAQDFAPVIAPAGAIAPWPHVAGYRDLFGFADNHIASAAIRRAWVFQDFGMTASRRERLRGLRQLAQRDGGERAGHGVFMLRGASGVRRVLDNEPALADALARRGFQIIDPEATSVAEMMTRIHGASVVCGVEGSQMTHAVLAAAPDAAIVCIQPPWRFNNIFKDYADALGTRYAFAVAEGGPDRFTIDTADVLRTIDLVHSDALPVVA